MNFQNCWNRGRRTFVDGEVLKGRSRRMPIILWLLGVPLGIVILLMLFGVVSF
jgi:hypothetical protein